MRYSCADGDSRPPLPPGRGAPLNPTNRFERIAVELEMPRTRSGRTQLLRDTSRSLITRNDSPDVGFAGQPSTPTAAANMAVSIATRGLPTSTLASPPGWTSRRILVKEAAPEILRKELLVSTLAAADAGHERRHGCLSADRTPAPDHAPLPGVLAEFRNPVGIVTKNHLVTRDIDHLTEPWRHIAPRRSYLRHHARSRRGAAAGTARLAPAGRLKAIRELAQAGVPIGVMVAPVIPASPITRCRPSWRPRPRRGRTSPATMLRLPSREGPLRGLAEPALPGRKEKVLDRIRGVRGGKLNDSRFGSRMRARASSRTK